MGPSNGSMVYTLRNGLINIEMVQPKYNWSACQLACFV